MSQVHESRLHEIQEMFSSKKQTVDIWTCLEKPSTRIFKTESKLKKETLEPEVRQFNVGNVEDMVILGINVTTPWKYFAPDVALMEWCHGTVDADSRKTESVQHRQEIASTEIDILDDRPHIMVYVKGQPYSTLIDTGAVSSYIGDQLAEQCRRLGFYQLVMNPKTVGLVNGESVEIHEAFSLKLIVGNVTFSEILYNLPNLSSNLVLGVDILRHRKFNINLAENKLTINGRLLNDKGSRRCQWYLFHIWTHR